MSSISDKHFEAISAIERACSVLSLLGCLFIIVTFCSSRSFHKPINRLVFYASFGNMMTNVGTLISRSYLTHLDSFACQFQACLIQLFMPADAFWTLTMAINVYLTFYYKFDAERLRRMELAYLVACYGVPAIPALAFLFIKNSQGVRVYGNAVLWCWIAPEWDVLRIAVFYGPVWIVIFVTFFIYLRAGRTIYEKRRQLRDFSPSEPDPLSVSGEPVATLKTTEVTITSEMAGDRGIQLDAMTPRDTTGGSGTSQTPNGAYSVHISAESNGLTHVKDDVALSPPSTTIRQTTSTQYTPRRPGNAALRRRNHELNNATWAYTKCSILFFTAILITWIPSSANRVYSLVHDKETSLPLEYMSAFVLPLQGFWNAVIYATTSWSACKDIIKKLLPKRRLSLSSFGVEGPSGSNSNKKTAHTSDHQRRQSQFRSAGSSGTIRSESTTELAKHKADSADGSNHC